LTCVLPGSHRAALHFDPYLQVWWLPALPDERPLAPVVPIHEDVWQDQPPGLLPQNDPEDTPGSITRDQQKSMHALFAALGVTDRADRLKVTAGTLKLPNLSSSSELSYAQAARLLQALAELQRKGTGNP